MSEVIVWNVFGMDVLDTNVHVSACLDIICRNIRLFEIVNSPSHGIRNCLITRWNPRSLNLGNLFRITCLLFQLACHVGNWLNCGLGLMNRVETARRIFRKIFVQVIGIALREVHFGYSSPSCLLVDSSFILAFVISVFLNCWVLN